MRAPAENGMVHTERRNKAMIVAIYKCDCCEKQTENKLDEYNIPVIHQKGMEYYPKPFKQHLCRECAGKLSHYYREISNNKTIVQVRDLY